MRTFASTEHDANSISGMGVFTLVLWIGCALIGVFGFILPYAHPRPQVRPPAIKVEMLEVKFADEPPPPFDPSQKSAVADPLAQPQIPQPVAVAQPSPAIAFALPVKGPVRIVEARQVAYTQSSSPAPVAAPAPQTLTSQQVEQWIPKPRYPPRALREGQQGTVMVKITVAEDGHVTAVEAKEPSRWFLLNDEALHSAREGHFPRGPLRIYYAPIRFVLR